MHVYLILHKTHVLYQDDFLQLQFVDARRNLISSFFSFLVSFLIVIKIYKFFINLNNTNLLARTSVFVNCQIAREIFRYRYLGSADCYSIFRVYVFHNIAI